MVRQPKAKCGLTPAPTVWDSGTFGFGQAKNREKGGFTTKKPQTVGFIKKGK